MSDEATPLGSTARRHVRLGWTLLLVFLLLGLTLETLHGLKIGWYLDVSNETRRLLWRLAHAHGALLGLVHIAFGVTLTLPDLTGGTWVRSASRCLTGSALLLPGGFLLGGTLIQDGDPFLGVLLVPFGAVLLFVGVLRVAGGLRT